MQLIHEEFETFYPKENSVDFLIALKSLVYALNQVDNTGTEHELKDLMSRYLRSLRIGGTGVFSGGEIQYMLELYQQAKMVNAFQIRKIAMKYEGCGIILDQAHHYQLDVIDPYTSQKYRSGLTWAVSSFNPLSKDLPKCRWNKPNLHATA